MMNKLYGQSFNTASKRKYYLECTERYLDASRLTDLSTGEIIYDGYPDICKDSSKKKSNKLMANEHSYVNRIYESLNSVASFYTINLRDIRTEWGKYDTLFNKTTHSKVKDFIIRNIAGPFFASLEISTYSGAHIHIVCGHQEGKVIQRYLKAEGKVYSLWGLVKYMKKSPIGRKTKNKDLEEYKVMVGTYLHYKNLSDGKRLPRRSFYRLF